MVYLIYLKSSQEKILTIPFIEMHETNLNLLNCNISSKHLLFVVFINFLSDLLIDSASAAALDNLIQHDKPKLVHCTKEQLQNI